jgi:hypothetical protein
MTYAEVCERIDERGVFTYGGEEWAVTMIHNIGAGAGDEVADIERYEGLEPQVRRIIVKGVPLEDLT